MTGIDESGSAIQRAEKNAEMNALRGSAAFVQDNVFSFLKKKAAEVGEKYDVIVCDPPAFVKSSAKIKEAVRAYRELNGLCMGLIKPGGILATSSCSYHLGKDMFLDMLRDASRDAQRGLRLLELRSQDKDHPVLLSMPETEYLKCAILLVD
jgi:23S rRNA (cytosine1962-C5)-methyltransferase